MQEFVEMPSFIAAEGVHFTRLDLFESRTKLTIVAFGKTFLPAAKPAGLWIAHVTRPILVVLATTY